MKNKDLYLLFYILIHLLKKSYHLKMGKKATELKKQAKWEKDAAIDLDTCKNNTRHSKYGDAIGQMMIQGDNPFHTRILQCTSHPVHQQREQTAKQDYSNAQHRKNATIQNILASLSWDEWERLNTSTNPRIHGVDISQNDLSQAAKAFKQSQPKAKGGSGLARCKNKKCVKGIIICKKGQNRKCRDCKGKQSGKCK